MYITIELPRGVGMTPGAVGVLLACLARRGGEKRWDGAVCEVFPGPRGTLMLVREARVSAAVAPYALPFLQKYL